jgi:hypothetical protein
VYGVVGKRNAPVCIEAQKSEIRDRNAPRCCTDRYSYQFKTNYFTEMCSGSEAGSYSRRIDLGITQLQA